MSIEWRNEGEEREGKRRSPEEKEELGGVRKEEPGKRRGRRTGDLGKEELGEKEEPGKGRERRTREKERKRDPGKEERE